MNQIRIQTSDRWIMIQNFPYHVHGREDKGDHQHVLRCCNFRWSASIEFCLSQKELLLPYKPRQLDRFVTPPRNRGGVIFSLQYVCLCVCLSVCLSVCEQNADQTATPIFTRSLLNSKLLIAVAQTLLKLGPRSRSQGLNINFS